MSSIEWTEETWNPTVGCSKISEGCRNCYAIKQAYRNALMGKNLANPGRLKYYDGLTEKRSWWLEWTGKVSFVPEALEVPLKRKKPTIFFVNSMSDLFHESISDEQIDLIFAVMALTPQHTYQVLTKRPEGMHEYMTTENRHGKILLARKSEHIPSGIYPLAPSWPLPNVWLGVSVENQKAANRRIPWLLRTPASIRFLSCEPLLEEVDIYEAATSGGCDNMPDWVICGAESGREARPFNENWARSLKDQCFESGIAFFYKQNAKNGRKIPLPELDGRQWTQMPEVPANVQ